MRNYWTKKRGIEAIRWLIDEKLKLSDSEVINNVNRDLFRKSGLGGCLRICFDDSPIKAIVESYPEKYKKEKNTIKLKN